MLLMVTYFNYYTWLLVIEKRHFSKGSSDVASP